MALKYTSNFCKRWRQLALKEHWPHWMLASKKTASKHSNAIKKFCLSSRQHRICTQLSKCWTQSLKPTSWSRMTSPSTWWNNFYRDLRRLKAEQSRSFSKKVRRLTKMKSLRSSLGIVKRGKISWIRWREILRRIDLLRPKCTKKTISMFWKIRRDFASLYLRFSMGRNHCFGTLWNLNQLSIVRKSSV